MVVLDYRLFMRTWPLLQEVFCNVHRAVTLALVPDGDKMEGGVRVRTLAADIGLARAGETAFVLHADMGAVIPPSQGCPCEITQGGTPRSLPRPRSAPLPSCPPNPEHIIQTRNHRGPDLIRLSHTPLTLCT